MNDAKQPGGSPSLAALEARIDRIRTNLATQQTRLSRASTLTALIGGALCLLMAVYFYVFYVQIREVMTPRKIVDAAESVVMDTLPDARKALEKEINNSADDWAADLSKQLQENMPKVRERLEDFIVSKSGEAFDHVEVLTTTQFRDFVVQNQAKLADGFRSFQNQEEADRFVQDLHKLVEEQMGRDMRGQSDDMLHMLLDLNSKLDTLKGGEKLNHEQALEREILMIAKRLQIETQAEQTASDSEEKPARARRPAIKSTGSDITAASSEPEEPKKEESKKEEPKKEEPKKEEPKKEEPKKEEPKKESE